MRPEEIAYHRGYRVTKEGFVTKKGDGPVKVSKNNCGYLIFGTGSKRFPANPFYNIAVHRLQAFMKFGKKMYEEEVVRHKNGDKADNHIDNILIGSHQDNQYDIPVKQRRKRSFKSAKTRHSLSDQQILEIQGLRAKGLYYYQIGERLGISKSWVYMILNDKTYYTQEFNNKTLRLKQ